MTALLRVVEDSEPLTDSQASPPSMIETFIALLETWKTIKIGSDSSWTFRGSEGVIFVLFVFVLAGFLIGIMQLGFSNFSSLLR